FGGTSLADASRFRDVLDIVKTNCSSKSGVIVLSAMSGVTNGLIACAQEAQKGDANAALQQLDALKNGHFQVIDELFADSASGRINLDPTELKQKLCIDIAADFNKLAVLLQGIAYLGELSKRSLDAISGYGELFSAPIFAAFAQAEGFSASFVDARTF